MCVTAWAIVFDIERNLMGVCWESTSVAWSGRVLESVTRRVGRKIRGCVRQKDCVSK